MKHYPFLCSLRSLAIVLLVATLPAVAVAAPAHQDPPTATESAPPQGETVVTDALGRTIEFAQPPQRIVAGGKAVRLTVDTLYLFPEARQRVVALEGRSPSMMEFLALVNPDMGWTMHYYSNIPGNYGSHLAPGDTADYWPGLSTVYLRVPWAMIEPEGAP